MPVKFSNFPIQKNDHDEIATAGVIMDFECDTF